MRAIRVFLISIVACGLILSSCKKEQAQVNHPPEIVKIDFSPNPPVEGSELKAVITTKDPDNDPVKLFFRWYKDGKLIKEGKDSILPASEVVASAEIYIEVQASDGKSKSGWIRSSKVKVVGPTGFIFRGVKIIPQNPYNDQILNAEIDCQECEDVVLHYKWWVNDKLVEDYDEPQLDPQEFGLKPGDKVRVEVGWEENGMYPLNFYTSAPIAIANRAPEFEGEGESWIEDNVFYFQAKAYDPDGEPVSYQAVQLPPGASFDSKNCSVKWAIPEGFQGRITVKIRVKDLSGGSNVLTYQTEIAPESQ